MSSSCSLLTAYQLLSPAPVFSQERRPLSELSFHPFFLTERFLPSQYCLRVCSPAGYLCGQMVIGSFGDGGGGQARGRPTQPPRLTHASCFLLPVVVSILYGADIRHPSHRDGMPIPHVDAMGGHRVRIHDHSALHQFLYPGLHQKAPGAGNVPCVSYLPHFSSLFFFLFSDHGRYSLWLASSMRFSPLPRDAGSRSGCTGRSFSMHSPSLCSSSTSITTPM